MYNKLKKLIEKHYYADRETAISKVDTVFLMNKITQEQYTDLMLLIDEYYPAEVCEDCVVPADVSEVPQE